MHELSRWELHQLSGLWTLQESTSKLTKGANCLFYFTVWLGNSDFSHCKFKIKICLCDTYMTTQLIRAPEEMCHRENRGVGWYSFWGGQLLSQSGNCCHSHSAVAVPTSHWAPLGCRMQQRHAPAPVKMPLLTVTQKVLNNGRHPTCIITHIVQSGNSRFFCSLLLLCFSSVSSSSYSSTEGRGFNVQAHE